MASVTKSVSVGAKRHVLLTAQGASLKLSGGNIEVHGPGTMSFRASMKELTGPLSVPSLDMAFKVGELNIKRDLEIEFVDADGNVLTNEPVSMRFSNEVERAVRLGADGKAKLKNVPLGPIKAKQPKRR